MQKIYESIKAWGEFEIAALQVTLNEFVGYHKKHLFDEDQSIAMGYEQMINLIKQEILRIKESWKEHPTLNTPESGS